MYILAIETTGPQLSVAAIDEKGKVAVRAAEPGFNHLTNLVPEIDNITKELGIELGDYEAIAVSKGPGSFTGIRIGVTTARALAQILGKKAIGVPTLETFIYHQPEFRGVVCPLFDARRSQVYAGAFIWEDGADANTTAAPREKVLTVCEGAAYDLDEYLAKLEEGMKGISQKEIMLYGDGVAPYFDRIKAFADEKGYTLHQTEKLVQNAESVARLALDMYKAGEIIEYGELQPDYMRKAEAERNLEAKKAREAQEAKEK